MLNKLLRLVLACIPFALTITATSVAAAPVPSPAIAEAQLRAINHRFVNAFAIADHAFIDGLTAQDFLLIGNSGDWITREKHIDMMKKPLVSGGVSYDAVRVRLFGNVAVLHGVFVATSEATSESSPANTIVRRVRYTDIYFWNGAQWQLVSAQNTPMRDGVSIATLNGVAPASARWAGTDPTGDETEVLRLLNESYVRAFRESDVSWYDAHLSSDYIVISSDGSVSDRAKALADFSKPTFATNLRDFPVGDVRIRRFDDIAIIHAENAYTLKDGRKGVSRYTDIWHKQANGRWLCIAAHINIHKAPA
jgi:ketosteroid isomerase-like protein